MAQKYQFEVEIKDNFAKFQKELEDSRKEAEKLRSEIEKITKSVKQSESNIKALSDGFKGMGLAIKSAGIGLLIEGFNQFKDVLSGNQKVVDTFTTSMNTIKLLGRDVMEIFNGGGVKQFFTADYYKNLLSDAEKLTEVNNKLPLAIAKQQGLVEEFDRKAEKQRQARDNEFKSIPERIKANEKLGSVLKTQEEQMLGLADLQIQAAKLNFEAAKTNENEAKLQEAKNNRAAIQAQIEGFRSEQIVNQISLQKELKDLTITTQDAEFERLKTRNEANDTLIKNDEQRFVEQLATIDVLKTKELLVLKERINGYEKNTQARTDAEQKYKDAVLKYQNELKTKQDEYLTYSYNYTQEQNKLVIDNEFNSYTIRLNALKKYNDEAQASTQISEDEKRRIQVDTLIQQRILERQKIALVANTLSNISQAFEQNSTEGKAFAVAASLINTYQGITAELATKTATPFEFGLKLANIAATAAIGFKSVKDIINTQVGDSGGGSAPEVTSAAPRFNVVGASGTNQIATAVNNQSNAPIKAYVVSKDITSQAALDRNIVNSASLG